MSDYVTTTMDTPFGECEVIVNDADHLSVWANGPLNVPDRRRTVMVNRVEYVVSAHFVRHEDGTWHTDGDQGRGEYFTCKKADSFKSDDFSWSARGKLVDGLTEAVNAWVETDRAKGIFAEVFIANHRAAVLAASSRIDRLKGELAEAQKAHAALMCPEAVHALANAARVMDAGKVTA